MAALDTIVTGMDATNRWLTVVSNNLANLNTPGFKGRRITFDDLLSQTLQGGSAPAGAAGGTGPVQIGLGVQVGAITPSGVQGALIQTGAETDLAIQGAGVLVLHSPSGQTVYSRDGALAFDALGNLVQASTGYKVMGWLPSGGTISPQGSVAPISFAGAQQMAPMATSRIALAGNLNVGAPAPQTLLVTAYDSLGTPIDIALTLQSVGRGLWAWHASLPRGGGVIAGATGTFGGPTPFTGTPTIPPSSQLGGGVTYAVQEDPAGNVTILDGSVVVAEAPGAGGVPAGSPVTFYNVQNGAVTTQVAMTATAGAGGIPAATGSTQNLGTLQVTSGSSGMITFTPQGARASQTGGPISITPSDGASALAIAPDWSATTQYGAPTTLALAGQDGVAPGALQSFVIGPDGVITGSYSNGRQQPIGQIALATFANPEGLLAVGQNGWQQSPDSGPVQVVPPGTGAAGTLTGGALEQSNVDLSEQLTEVIQAQSSFQADARVITAVNAMLQAAIQMVP